MDNRSESIVNFAQTLIKIPSQGGIDPPDEILKVINDWFESNQLHGCILLDQEDRKVGFSYEIVGIEEGPTYCLNACTDTAPFGDLDQWKFYPTSAIINNGWLYGRGSADSKISVSIFSHIAKELSKEKEKFKGTISFLFDADEHSGKLGGIKTFVKNKKNIDGVMIGYPGNYGVIIGARGFFRAKITVYGTSMHTGSTKPITENAIEKASLLVHNLSKVDLPCKEDALFQLDPKLTVTSIRGGEGYSIVPDKCVVSIDMRLTPKFDSKKANNLIQEMCIKLDEKFKTHRSTEILYEESWPAYILPNSCYFADLLAKEAASFLKREVPKVICGPSNIGNYLSTLGIQATCGFGVTYKSYHAPNECIDLSSINVVGQTYLSTIKKLLLV